MRIVVDVNLPETIARFLNDAGHDAVWSGSILPHQSPDTDIVASAIHNHRVVLTKDLGIAEIILKSRRPEPSLITLRLGDPPIETIYQALASHLPSLEENLLRGALVTIDDKGPRVHPLEGPPPHPPPDP